MCGAADDGGIYHDDGAPIRREERTTTTVERATSTVRMTVGSDAVCKEERGATPQGTEPSSRSPMQYLSSNPHVSASFAAAGKTHAAMS